MTPLRVSGLGVGATGERELRAEGQRVFGESGWVLPQEALLRHACDHGEALVYDDVSSL